MKQKVVIIGHGFTSRLSVIRAVGSIGCEVTVIVMTGYRKFTKILNTSKPVDCYSKYVKNIYYCYGKDKEGLIQTLIDKCTDQHQKVVIIPDSDFSAAVVDENADCLRDHFLFPNIDYKSGEIVAWMDKTKQKQLAHKIGLNVVPSCVIAVKNRNYTIPLEVNFPCFTKPLATINGGGKQIFRRCDNVAELCEVLDLVASISDMHVLVEDFKTIKSEYAVVGFSDGKDVIIPGIIQILEMSHGGHFGVAYQGKAMPINGYENLVSKFKQYVLDIGFVGLFDIDFFESEGSFFFCEMNLRFGGSGYAITKMGVNLPGMLVKKLVGEGIDGMKKTLTSTATFVNERMCMDDWYLSYISEKEYEEKTKAADISFVRTEDDPMPYIAYIREFRIKKIKKFLKSFLRK